MRVNQPLPDKLRPNDIENFVGQEHIRERISILLNSPRLPSLLLFGPPGCGKSTLALLLAMKRIPLPVRISAPEVGLQQMRKMLSGTEVLVLDELHRFSKAQQDFFLPLLESGELTLIATTTENPSFSVTRQLLSRLEVLRLKALSMQNLAEIALRATTSMNIELSEDVIEYLTISARGDARVLLNLIEYISFLPSDKQNLEYIKSIMPEIVVRHDKDGDSHYEYASALIKSIRGSDPNAAIYYLACLLEGGEDPRFICRRLILSASEDVGLGDPHALPLAVACQQAVEFVGLPEGVIPLAETTVYLALAPKSNATYAAYHAAVKEIRMHGTQNVPFHLRNANTSLQRQWGYGKEYKYPHNYPHAWIEQAYLPENVAGNFYTAHNNGEEPKLNAWLQHVKSMYHPK